MKLGKYQSQSSGSNTNKVYIKGHQKQNLLGPRWKVKRKSRLGIKGCKSRTQPTFHYSNLTTKTLEQGVKYVES